MNVSARHAAFNHWMATDKRSNKKVVSPGSVVASVKRVFSYILYSDLRHDKRGRRVYYGNGHPAYCQLFHLGYNTNGIFHFIQPLHMFNYSERSIYRLPEHRHRRDHAGRPSQR